MISLSEFKDATRRATAFPMSMGVVFRWPLGLRAGSMMLASRGHSPCPPIEVCDLQISELILVSAAYDFIGYRGQDSQRHYFVLPNDTTIGVAQSELEISRLPIQLGMCLFVAFTGDRIGIADPITVSLTQPESCQWALTW